MVLPENVDHGHGLVLPLVATRRRRTLASVVPVRRSAFDLELGRPDQVATEPLERHQRFNVSAGTLAAQACFGTVAGDERPSTRLA